jgi:peptidoglycan/LPS O-acetylase OafA/YrhL
VTPNRIQQIDVLKGLAAIAVVATHTLSASRLIDTWSVFHIWQAVPLFVAILGVNAALSFSRKANGDLKSLLTREYLLRRASRILFPFTLVWVLAWIVGRDRGGLQFGPESILLQLPYPGPGNYYVPLVVVLLLLAPFLYVGFRKRPWVALALLLLADLAFELVAARVSLFVTHPFVYSVAFPRYLGVFALGFFIVDDRVSARARAIFLGLGTLASLTYLVVGNAGLWAPPFVSTWRTQNVLAAFYPATIAALGIRFLPSSGCGVVTKALTWTGRASYHIFLMQMLYFMLVPQFHGALMIVVNVVMCVLAGLGFYEVELRLRLRGSQGV